MKKQKVRILLSGKNAKKMPNNEGGEKSVGNDFVRERFSTIEKKLRELKSDIRENHQKNQGKSKSRHSVEIARCSMCKYHLSKVTKMLDVANRDEGTVSSKKLLAKKKRKKRTFDTITGRFD